MSIIKTISLSTVVCLLLVGCKTQDAYTGEEKVNRATKYGGIAALVCAALGSRKNSDQALKAAAGCGLIAAGIGTYMDAQERKLRNELVGSGVQVAREGDNIRLIMPNSITFSTNKSDLNTSIYNTLNAVSKVLTEFKESALEVGGHTDSTGSASYNQKLSVKRATSVANYLQQRNVPGSRLRVVGYGETRPIASNNSKAGRAENRRAELLIVPQAS